MPEILKPNETLIDLNSDPLNLKSKIVDTTNIKNKKLKQFYLQQNELINNLLHPFPLDSRTEDENIRLVIDIYLYENLIAIFRSTLLLIFPSSQTCFYSQLRCMYLVFRIPYPFWQLSLTVFYFITTNTDNNDSIHGLDIWSCSDLH